MAPDSFKGTITASLATKALAEGWASVRPSDTVIQVPMADGGEGTLAAFEATVEGAVRMPLRVHGPDGAIIDAHWLALPNGTAVVELAITSGIERVNSPTELRALDFHTVGFGEAIRAAISSGANRLVLAIGGSASSDGGAGMFAALGARLLDSDGQPVAPSPRGLQRIAQVDFSNLLSLPPGGAVVLTDVSAPLLGPMGAAAMFAPQKGASKEEVAQIDHALERWARILDAIPSVAGYGAAGGTGMALSVWGARLTSGAREVARLVGLDKALKGADVVITGEGRFDGQSENGKVPSIVTELARSHGVSVTLVAGCIDSDTSAFDGSISLTDLAGSAERAMFDPRRHLEQAAAQLAGSVEWAPPR